MDQEDVTGDQQQREEDVKENEKEDDVAINTHGYKSLEASFEEDFNQQ